MDLDYLAIAPELTLTITALLVLLVDLVLPAARKRWLNPLCALGTSVALGFAAWIYGRDLATFCTDGERCLFVANDYAVVFKLLFLGTLLAILAVSYHYFSEGRYFQGEYYFLLLTAFLGMIVMPSARDLVLLFVALETVSVPAFVMAGLRKRDLYSSEAAIKFFLIGVLAAAVMLFGMSFVYGTAGTTYLEGIAQALAAEATPQPILLGAVLLVIVGFGFKVSAVPFHFWAPDTYAGSPLPVTAMLAVASKAAGFAGLVMICFIAFEPLAGVWAPAMAVLAVATMTIGNLVALQQRDIVRLLAYSSVAHAGYMLVPFGIAATGATFVNRLAVQAVLFYLLAYAVMNVGAFAAVIAFHRRSGRRSLSDYAGLGARSPGLALGMTIFLLALGGAPLTVGLWAKYIVFFAAAGAAAYVLAAAVVINTVIGFFYYLAVIRTVWMDEPDRTVMAPRPGFLLNASIGVLAAATVVLGAYPVYQDVPVEGVVRDAQAVTASDAS